MEPVTDPDLRACVRLHNEVLPWAALQASEVEWVVEGRHPIHTKWLAERDEDGTVIGIGWRGDGPAGTIAGVAVAHAHRGRGIGGRLLAGVLDGIAGEVWGHRGDGSDPGAVRLGQRFGFEELHDPDPTHWRSSPLQPADDLREVEVLTHEHLDDDDFVEAFTRLAAASVEDSPGQPPPTSAETVAIERRRIETGGFTVLVRAGEVHRELVACATASAAPWSPWLTSDHTLVVPCHRNKGYGTTAKRHQHAEATRRGFERIVTDVRPDNTAMRRILAGLGYEPVRLRTWKRIIPGG
jgi:GNAT superfamily N-acetyltransferase